MDLYRHHKKCGCKLFAYVWPCEEGPKSVHCVNREYGLIEKQDSRCAYHAYHDWHPPVHEPPSPVPSRSTTARASSPVPYLGPRKILPEDKEESSSPWVTDEPDIDVEAARTSLRARGRLARARAASTIGTYAPSGSDSDVSDSPTPDHYTYGQGYCSDSWEDLYHPGFASGTDTSIKPVSPASQDAPNLARRTVALVRAQRERRLRARLGDERFEARLAIAAQRRRVREEEDELRSRMAEHRATMEEYGTAVRRAQKTAWTATPEEKPDLTYATEADMKGFLFY